jgi:hypothetical protein
MRDIYPINKQARIFLFLPVKAYALITITANNDVSENDASGQTV